MWENSPPPNFGKSPLGVRWGKRKKSGRREKEKGRKRIKRERKEKEKRKRERGRENSKLKVVLKYSFWQGVQPR